MPESSETHIASLLGRLDEGMKGVKRACEDVRSDVKTLDQKVDRRFERVDQESKEDRAKLYAAIEKTETTMAGINTTVEKQGVTLENHIKDDERIHRGIWWFVRGILGIGATGGAFGGWKFFGGDSS